jgi:aminoglycoside phosphotransferase
MRHRVIFGIEESSGREVAAKIELIAGALEVERRALEWLTARGGPSPRLLAAGELVGSGEHAGALCLVTDRVAGVNPTSVDGWRRLGGALAIT